MLLGASVGAFISLIVVLLGQAWLEVTSGKLKGTEFILDKFMHAGGPAIAIGSSPLKSEIVLPDPDIAPQHAMLTGDGKQFTVKDMSLSGTFINNKKVEASPPDQRPEDPHGQYRDGLSRKEVVMRKITRIILTFSLLFMLTLVVRARTYAQDANGPQIKITQVDNSKFPQVTVYVSVTDAAGEPVGVDPSTIQTL